MIVNNAERINTRERNTINTMLSVQSVMITFILSKCHRSIKIPLAREITVTICQLV